MKQLKNAKPVFQFSSIDNKTYCEKLEEVIRRLDGGYDNSRNYSPKATHLIVDKIECTEKILCFIAAGKWILTQSYLKYSYKEKQFLNEIDYHVSKYFTNSKLANVSLKWKKLIDQCKSNAPFMNWNVACLLKDEEKAKALIRIIKAGYGNATYVSSNLRQIRCLDRITLVIADEVSESVARKLADDLSVPCYPFQSIPDYIIQCVPNTLPVLPLKYYQYISRSPNESMSKEDDHEQKQHENNLVDFITNVDYFLTPLNRYSSKSNKKIEFIDPDLEDRFMSLWNNHAYYYSINFLNCIQTDKIPSTSTFTCLMEFLLKSSSTIKRQIQFQLPTNANLDKCYEIIYQKIFNYVWSRLMLFPPIGSNIKYFNHVFQNLFMDLRINQVNGDDVKSIIDVIHFMCVFDYLLINMNNLTKGYEYCSFLINKLADEKKHVIIIRSLLKKKNIGHEYYVKMLEIIAFCNKYLEPSKLYQNVALNYFQFLIMNSAETPAASIKSLDTIFRLAFTNN